MIQVLFILALLGVAAAFLVVFVFKDEGISKSEWQGVPLGSTKQQVTKRIGDPSSSQVKAGDTYYFYKGATVVEFVFHRGRLSDKVWLDGHLSENAIGPAQRHAVDREGVTQRQVTRRFGAPVQRKDEVYDLKLMGGHAMLSFGFARFQHIHCISYLWKPRPGKVVDFCFDAKSGKLLT